VAERAIQPGRGHADPEPGRDDGEQAGGQRHAGPFPDVGPLSAVPRALLRHAVPSSGSSQAPWPGICDKTLPTGQAVIRLRFPDSRSGSGLTPEG